MVLWNEPVTTMDGAQILMDLFTTESSVSRGVLLYLHGGGFTGGCKEQFLSIASAVALETGWLCASLGYRLASAAPFPAQLLDVYAAIEHLANHAEHFRLDMSKVVLAGGSPGGSIAALAMLTSPQSLRLSTAPPFCFNDGILLNGIVDFCSFIRTNPSEKQNLLAFLPDEASWKTLSPTQLLHSAPEKKEFLLIHGGKDRIVPLTDGRCFVQAAHDVGHRAQTFLIPEAEHAWFNEPALQPPVIEAICTYLRRKDKGRHHAAWNES